MKTLDMFSRVTPLLAGAAIATSLFVQTANAQALTPMRQIISAYNDRFSVRVTPKNPYKHRIRLQIRVYDQDFKLVKARVSPRDMMIGAGQGRSVTVTVPFEGQRERKVRICAESIPFPQQKALIKTQVCGKFFARRLK